MIRVFEALAFLSLAIGVHVGLWAAAPQAPGASAPGGAGQAPMTLAAASAQQAALARAWQAPPRAATQVAQPEPAAAPPHDLRRPSPPRAAPSLPPAPALPAISRDRLPGVEPAPGRTPPRTTPARPGAMTPPDTRPAPRTQTWADPAVRRNQPPQPVAPRPEAPAFAGTAPPAPPPEPAPDSAPESAPERTAGGGRAETTARGRDGRDATQSADADRRNALQARWGARIQRKVHRRLIYPRGATGGGVARVALTVDRSGRLTGLRLTRSSGVAAFDTAALNAVRRAGRFPAAPRELTRERYDFTLSLSFRP